MKLYIRSMQSIFAGTHYDKKAAQKLIDAGMDEAEANALIKELFTQNVHAFVHAPNWAEKYLVGMARMAIEESNGNLDAIAQFLRSEDTIALFDKFMSHVRENREKLGGTNFDTQFMNVLHYQDIVDLMAKVQEELDRESEEALAKLREEERAKSNYEVVPINSYDQMHNMFGGHWTGDGSSDAYAGGGGTAWCHTNAPSTYDSWLRRGSGKCKFYVLARKNFKDIPFDRNSNRQNPKDDYGNSLIALLVDKKTGELLNATLRCNHVGVESEADKQYKTYGELSRLAGFNIKDFIFEDLGTSSGELAIKPVPLTKAKFAMGDRVSLSITGYGDFTATVVQRIGNSSLFVFDDVLGYGKMVNMETRLQNIWRGIEDTAFQDRVFECRLLEASELFSGCDDSDEWSYLTDFGVEMEGAQIPYFVSADHRGLPTEENRGWWTSSKTEDEEHFVVVKNDGGGNCFNDKKRRGIRPALRVQDL